METTTATITRCFIWVPLLAGLTLNASAQQTYNLNDLLDSGREVATLTGNAGEICSYFGETSVLGEIHSFVSNDNALRIVKRITESVALPQNFTVREAQVPNAAAVIQGELRLVLYNNDFMEAIDRSAQTDWAGLSILAHEVGHHLSGHTLTEAGSRPALELEADKFSGFVVARLGGPLEGALAAMRSLGSPEGSSTHPAMQRRLDAITEGWQSAQNENATPTADSAGKTCITTSKQTLLPVQTLSQLFGTGQALSRANACSQARSNARSTSQSCESVFDKGQYSNINSGAERGECGDCEGDFSGYSCQYSGHRMCTALRTEVIEVQVCED